MILVYVYRIAYYLLQNNILFFFPFDMVFFSLHLLLLSIQTNGWFEWQMRNSVSDCAKLQSPFHLHHVWRISFIAPIQLNHFISASNALDMQKSLVEM